MSIESGKILHPCSPSAAGIILTESGERLTFAHHDSHPGVIARLTPGAQVQFIGSGDTDRDTGGKRRARRIELIRSEPAEAQTEAAADEPEEKVGGTC